MELQKCCFSSEFACNDSGRFSISYLDNNIKPQGMHTQNNLELYYSTSTGKCFIIDDIIYSVNEHDVFLVNPFEAHRVEPLEGQPHNRYILSIMPDFLKTLSSSNTDLTACFYDKKKFSSRVSFSKSQHKKMMELIDKLTSANGFGSDLVENAILTEIILLVVNASKSTTFDTDEPKNKYIADILNYIDQSLDEDLSLEKIADRFHLSKGYLCRLFKEHTCTTIHEYICTKRISKAKQLLATGHTVQETISKTGFNDYANFIRRFKEKVGISPKKYAKEHTIFPAE
ncbi:MAG: AraC family transcriptional regulator [Oscillospiraceae bacterium]|nr:AraC family transcriptional regulator [Oscillospiraceae bacterium]